MCARLSVGRWLWQPDVVHINVSSRLSTYRKLVICLWAKLLGYRVVLHLHGSGYDGFFARQSGLVRRAITYGFSRADALVVLGEGWRRFAEAELGVAAQRVVRLSNATPGPVGGLNEVRKSDGLRVLFLGRVGPRKGTDVLLHAVRQAASEGGDIHLDIAGDGDLNALDMQISSLGLSSRVTVHGWVTSERAFALLGGTDVLVLPSLAENQPMSIIEAFSFGHPVIATGVGAIPEMIDDGRNGWIVEVGDSTAIAKILLQLSADRKVLVEAGAAARRRWEEDYDITAHNIQLKRIWMSTISSEVRH